MAAERPQDAAGRATEAQTVYVLGEGDGSAYVFAGESEAHAYAEARGWSEGEYVVERSTVIGPELAARMIAEEEAELDEARSADWIETRNG